MPRHLNHASARNVLGAILLQCAEEESGPDESGRGSLVNLAKAIGISEDTLAAIIKGKFAPKLDTLRKIAGYLNRDADGNVTGEITTSDIEEWLECREMRPA